MEKFLPAILIIAGGISTGVLLRKLIEHFWPKLTESLPSIRKRIQFTCLAILNPIAFAGAVWILPTGNPGLFLLPVVGLGTLVAGFGGGFLGARLLHLGEPKATTFRMTISFTNLGNIGGLVLFLLSGEAAFALVPFYKLLEETWYYGFLYPYARRKAESLGRIPVATGKRKNELVRALCDPFLFTVLVAVIIGFSANLLGFHRPTWYATVNANIVPFSTFCFLVALGLGLRFSKLGDNLKPALVLVALKYTVMPLAGVAIALLFGFASTPIMLEAVLVLSAMPVAFSAVVPPTLFKLDLDFANTAFLVSVAGLAITVPVLAYLVTKV